jgi:hypothetical protein
MEKYQGNVIKCTQKNNYDTYLNHSYEWFVELKGLDQCFSTAGPRPVTRPWHYLYRAARGSPGSYHFSFLSIFHE